jgi:hypothetical protein
MSAPSPVVARAPLWADATQYTTAQPRFSINKPFFVAPPGAGRRITAGFFWIQRIGKAAAMDVWFPDMLRRELELVVASGGKIGPEYFPAQWAAVRQFELLQEAGNYKIYDMDATYLSRTLVDLARNMRAGGYRVTVATIGSYDEDSPGDDLEILDRRLQDRISHLTHMLYLEEQSREINDATDRALAEERWNYQTALPHVALTLGARDLFRGRDSTAAGRKHALAAQFFGILGRLSQKHIVHDTAVGLQLPESVAEQEWIYLAAGEDTLRAFNGLLGDLFSPFDRMSLGRLDGRADARDEIKSSVQHMRGYGDRLTDEADRFHREAASYARHGLA